MGPLGYHYQIFFFLDIAAFGFRLKLLYLKSLFSQNYTEERNVRILVFVLALSQALDLLVSVRYTHYCASTPGLST